VSALISELRLSVNVSHPLRALAARTVLVAPVAFGSHPLRATVCVCVGGCRPDKTEIVLLDFVGCAVAFAASDARLECPRDLAEFLEVEAFECLLGHGAALLCEGNNKHSVYEVNNYFRGVSELFSVSGAEHFACATKNSHLCSGFQE
jgi:hypothetical protein